MRYCKICTVIASKILYERCIVILTLWKILTIVLNYCILRITPLCVEGKNRMHLWRQRQHCRSAGITDVYEMWHALACAGYNWEDCSSRRIGMGCYASLPIQVQKTPPPELYNHSAEIGFCRRMEMRGLVLIIYDACVQLWRGAQVIEAHRKDRRERGRVERWVMNIITNIKRA